MNRRYRRNHLAIASLSLAALLLGAGAATATAAPTFGLQLERDAAGFPIVSRSDERVDYTLKVSNTAAPLSGVPSVGEKLFCNGAGAPLGSHNDSWFRETGPGNANYSFEFRWVRNGEAITPWTPGAPGTSYTVQAADQEKALQCLVKGTNGAKTGSYVAASQPVVVADPQPAVEPPKPTEPTEVTRRPQIEGEARNPGEELTCTAPSAWTGSPSWTFEWLRNGVERPGAPGSYPGEGEVTETTATTSKFKIASSELFSKAVFQCVATASNAGGSAIVESFPIKTESPSPEFVENTEDNIPQQTIFGVAVVERAENTLIGPITLELELPGGLGTYAARALGNGWTCDTTPAFGAQHAKATCTRSGVLLPGASYPPLTVVAALGADAPDPAVATATVFGGAAPVSASDEFSFAPAIPFGLTAFEAKVLDQDGNDHTQAGGHGHAGIGHLELAKKRRFGPENTSDAANFAPIENPKQIFTELPRGFVGSIEAIPQLCPSIDEVLTQSCPNGSQIGRAFLTFSGADEANGLPIYAIEPDFGAPIQIAILDPFGDVYVLTPRLRPDDGYAVTLEAAPGPSLSLLEATVTICGFGAKVGGANFACWKADEAGAYEKPFFTNPTRCADEPPVTRVRLNSWPNPDHFAESSFTNAALTGCELVDFEPTIELKPTSSQADSPTGMQVELTMPTEGIEDPDGIAQANLKRAKVTLPEGMSVNATAGQGLAACTMAQIGFEEKAGEIVPNNNPVACPNASKIGTVEVDTPLLEETFKGDVYIAKQSDNPFGSLLALYMVIDSPKNGILVKLAGLVEPNKDTGQLEVTFNENPEVPFSSVRLDFPQGPRSPLLNPPMCGDYEILTELSPWNAQDPENPTEAEIVKQTSPFSVTAGPNGGPCPTGALDPKLNAGVTNPVAGQTSPFVLRLHRDDGTQRFAGLSVSPPLGLTAYLKGIPYCPQATIDAISEDPGTGQLQIDAPSCPAASQIGTAVAGAGAGLNPLYVETGKAYLSGPYKGAPISLVVVAPAVAGPIDLGNVVIQTALHVDPKTAQISAVSDPIPTILHGILLDVRDVRVAIDRPSFILNPTDCSEKQIAAQVRGASGAIANLSTRFQVAGCENLGFKPRLNLRLFGGTKRGDYQGVRAVVRPRAGDANIAGTVVRFPRSAFVAQEHLRNICTRVQFAADACPKGSIYGKALAYSPLLDYPLEGNVYLRSSDNELPDVVADLRGPAHQPIRIELAIRNDSVKGALRNTVQSVPDAPVSYFRLQLFGGDKGLIVNSRDICKGTNRAAVRLNAQNGDSVLLRPTAFNSRCVKQRKGAKGRKRK